MRLSPAQLSGRLARGLAPLYAVAGDEPLLITEAVDAIRAAARAAGHAEREVFDAERDFDWNGWLARLATGSLFASRRLIELRLGAAPGEAGAAALRQLAADPIPAVVMLVTAGALDSRSRSGGWYAALEKAGVAVYCWRLTPTEFPGWLAQRARALGLRLSPAALGLLVARTQGNPLAAVQELGKLALLAGDAAIDEARLAQAVADSARLQPFDWNDRLLAGDALGVVRGLRRLRDEGEALPALVGALAFDLRLLAGLRSPREAAALRLPRHRVAAYTEAARRGAGGRVGDWLVQLAAIDRLGKSSGGQAPAWEALLALALAIAGCAPRADAPAAR
ncbi:MAG: DNA polymerase III subunit delta [Gammaproteobacteria bacterium]|nr:DNA polymerase III subunit delta [Gammaproteobacteria bacterium]